MHESVVSAYFISHTVKCIADIISREGSDIVTFKVNLKVKGSVTVWERGYPTCTKRRYG